MNKKVKSEQPKIVVKQIASPIRREAKQRLYLKSLGLGKIDRTRELIDSPAVRGLITKLSHMVKVIDNG